MREYIKEMGFIELYKKQSKIRRAIDNLERLKTQEVILNNSRMTEIKKKIDKKSIPILARHLLDIHKVAEERRQIVAASLSSEVRINPKWAQYINFFCKASPLNPPTLDDLTHTLYGQVTPDTKLKAIGGVSSLRLALKDFGVSIDPYCEGQKTLYFFDITGLKVEIKRKASNATGSSSRESYFKLKAILTERLQAEPEAIVNLSALAIELGLTRARVSQIYKRIASEQVVPRHRKHTRVK